MPTMKKGAEPASSTPKRNSATAPRLRPEPRKHEGPEARRLRRMAEGLHPIDAANHYAWTFDPDDRLTMTRALRDLAIAYRREAGQRRRNARTAVDVALARFGPDDDLLNAIANLAVRLVDCWT